MSDHKTISVYDQQAAKYADLTQNDARDAQLLAFIDDIVTGGHVLDLGCGPGQCAAAMAQSGLQVTAMDASEEMVAMAAQHKGVHARLGTFDNLGYAKPYDGVWANFSLLHAPRADMPRHLSAIADALVKGGCLHIGLKLGKGEARDALGRFYTYYSLDELTGLLTNAGFVIAKTTQGSGKGLSGTDDDWITVRAHA